MTTKSSSTLDREVVREIGLVSPSFVGGCTLGIGIMLESFQTAGTIPDRSNILKMLVTGSVNSWANYFTNLHGTLSGPWALKDLMASIFLQTSKGRTVLTLPEAGRKGGSIITLSDRMCALTKT